MKPGLLPCKMVKKGMYCVLSFLPFLSCNNKQEKLHPAEEKITETVYASGILKSKNQYEVFSTVNGLVTEVVVSEGDTIKKGDAVMRLNNTAVQINSDNMALAAAFSAVTANEEKLTDLKNTIALAALKMQNDASLLQRQQNLWNQQIGSRNELEQREMTYNNSVTAYRAAKLHYTTLVKLVSYQAAQAEKNSQLSKVMAGDYTVTSETDGKVYHILKKKGEMVNTQSPVALIGDAAVFILELQVDEYDITRIRPGQKIMLTMDSYRGQVFEAVVKNIIPGMNERTQSFTVEALFTKKPAALYPNLTCEANIIIALKEKAITIPESYLLDGGYVLLENKEKRKVQTGLKDYQKVEILSGLSVNETILKPLK